MAKIKDLKQVVDSINDRDSIAFGGNVLHRTPMAMVREIARQRKKELHLIKTAGAMDIDLLCAMGCVQSVSAGFVSYETKLGLANHYRKAVQSGSVTANEHACYTIICALRAASMNIPFMPVYGMKSGDLLAENDYFAVMDDPFGAEPVTVVKALTPDIAIIHVHECDEKGNALIYGPKFEDILLSRAAKRVIVTSERIVPEGKVKLQPCLIDIPELLVSDVVHAPKGAAPTSCYDRYAIDERSVSTFLSLKSIEDIESYISSCEVGDYFGSRTGRFAWTE